MHPTWLTAIANLSLMAAFASAMSPCSQESVAIAP